MAQRKQLTWSELRVGLFVLVGLLILAVGIFYITGAGFLGPKYHLKTFLGDVSGLANGAPVRLDGVEIGNVDMIRIVPREPGKTPDRLRSIEVGMRLDRKFQPDILTDSTATLVTEGLLGNRYLNIQRGYTGTPLKEGQAVAGAQEKSIKDVMDTFTGLTVDVQQMLADVKAGKGNLGKLLNDEEAYNHLNSVLGKADIIASNIRDGRGTAGRLLMTDELYTKVNKGVDQVTGMLDDLKAQKGTIGKLLYDPTLYDQAKEALDNGNVILSDVRAGKGTLGKLATDDTLYTKLKETSTNLSSATAKLNQNTSTAGKLFQDPQLYDNITGLTGDMRSLLAEFRKNPKKFLSIRLTFF
jgi:phospholipid/cholesterol/gamma-HCH transport system substrate-binding protein